jgi:hypothetical protein
MPERFIEGCGKHLYQYLPFSTGHRMCPELCVTLRVNNSDGYIRKHSHTNMLRSRKLSNCKFSTEYIDKFMPERFIEGCGKHLYQYLPFSTGHRMCPAKKFMMTMIKTVVITFVERVKIRTV